MSPRARIVGGEMANSPIRVIYDSKPAGGVEECGGRTRTFKQVLSKPSRLLLGKAGAGKSASCGQNSQIGSIPQSNVGHKLRSRSSAKVSDTLGSPLMETQQMSDALPKVYHPQPRRVIPSLTEELNFSVDSSGETLITALPRFPHSDSEHDGRQKRKSSNELADALARSQPKTKPELSPYPRSGRGLARISRIVTAQNAVMKWMDDTDNSPTHQEGNTFSKAGTPENFDTLQAHTAVDLVVLDSGYHSLSEISHKPSPGLELHVHPLPVSDQRASARPNRDSSMTAASLTASIFSRASHLSDQTFLTMPSEQIPGEAQSKGGSRDSRDSWRYTRSFASPRSSTMSYSSIPFRSRPFRIEDVVDDDGEEMSGELADASGAMGERPLSLSPVRENQENQESKNAGVMGLGCGPEQKSKAAAQVLRDDRTSKSPRMDKMGYQAVDHDGAEDAEGGRSARSRGASSPGMPGEIFGYQTLDFGGKTMANKSTDVRQSDLQDVPDSERVSRSTYPHVAMASAWSEASLSPTVGEFSEGSSGITDETGDETYQLSDFPGVGPALQVALANIRRDVLDLVVLELEGISSHAQQAGDDATNSPRSNEKHVPSSMPPNASNGVTGGIKRAQRDCGGDEQENHDEGDQGKRRKLNAVAINTSILRSRFACPFYKRNPDAHQRWRSCRGPGWEEVRRVKEHVYRRHMLFTCPRCLQNFEDKAALENHAQTDVPCTKANTPPLQEIEGCSQDQERKLRCRKRPPGETDEDRWAEMYRILFGYDSEVPGPYYDFDLPLVSPATPTDLPLIEDTLRQLPQRLATDISHRLRRPLDDEERDALPDIIRTSLQAIMPPFWRLFALTPSSDTRAAPPSSEQGDSAYGSAEHDRESSAPSGRFHASQPSQNATPQRTPTQGQPKAGNVRVHRRLSKDFTFPPSECYHTPNQNSGSTPLWSQTPSAIDIPQMPGSATFPPQSHLYPTASTPTTMQTYMPVYSPTHPTLRPLPQFQGDPPISSDFGDLLVPALPFALAGERWPPPSSPADVPNVAFHPPLPAYSTSQEIHHVHGGAASNTHEPGKLPFCIPTHTPAGFYQTPLPTPTGSSPGFGPGFGFALPSAHLGAQGQHTVETYRPSRGAVDVRRQSTPHSAGVQFHPARWESEPERRQGSLSTIGATGGGKSRMGSYCYTEASGPVSPAQFSPTQVRDMRPRGVSGRGAGHGQQAKDLAQDERGGRVTADTADVALRTPPSATWSRLSRTGVHALQEGNGRGGKGNDVQAAGDRQDNVDGNVNLLTTTEQIDEWMWNLNSAASGTGLTSFSYADGPGLGPNSAPGMGLATSLEMGRGMEIGNVMGVGVAGDAQMTLGSGVGFGVAGGMEERMRGRKVKREMGC